MNNIVWGIKTNKKLLIRMHKLEKKEETYKGPFNNLNQKEYSSW